MSQLEQTRLKAKQNDGAFQNSLELAKLILGPGDVQPENMDPKKTCWRNVFLGLPKALAGFLQLVSSSQCPQPVQPNRHCSSGAKLPWP